MKRLLIALTIVGLFLTPAGGALAADTVKVGVVLPLSGSLAPFGEASLNGLRLGADLINESGGVEGLGGAKIELVVTDAQSDPASAASATQRLVSQERVVAVIGAYASSLSLAASTVTERNRIPFLTMSFTDQLTSRGYQYIFQNVAKASAMGAAQLRYTLEIAESFGEPVDRIAIVYENTAYGSSQADGLAAEAERLGIEVALNEAYPAGITNATPVVNAIEDARADVVFPVSYFTDAVLIIRSMRQSELNIPVVGGAAGYVIPEFYEALGEFAEGILSSNTSNYDNYKELDNLYRQRHGQFMTHEAFEHLALLYALEEAMNEAESTDPTEIAEALREIKITSGPVAGLPGGGIDFDETGMNVLTYPVMVQWQDGELVTVWPEEEAHAEPVWPQ